ncbi:MAG: arylesterase [Desulfuromonadales bacterium]|nr:arylesterase [Desulfuromonadales bacterium]
MKFISTLVKIFLLLLLPSVAAADEPLRILVLGDSLTAGHGLAENEAFPAKLQQALQTAGHNVLVINAGVSGDTTAGGLARLDWALADRPQIVIVELGANDALRGLPPESVRKNLTAIITRLQQEKIAVLLTGMRAPRNLGADYYHKFDQLYPELARQHQVAFYPFFLQDVATIRHYNQSDGIHPNAAGVKVIVQSILPTVERLIRQRTSS